MKKLLVIGTIWPEPNKTAAGYRMLQIIDLFKEEDFEILFCSAAKLKPATQKLLEARESRLVSIQLNNNAFDDLLQREQPSIVMYDRFLIEEQYGWRVRESLPQALQLLDTEDLHFLREARRQNVEQQVDLDVGFQSELAIREVSSMLRVDLSLIISTYEMKLLEERYGLDPSLLLYLPFLIERQQIEYRKSITHSFDSRTGFCTIGNLRHAPNVDAVRQLKFEIWPGIRKQLLGEDLYIYGAYAPQEILKWHDPENGFNIKGHVPSVDAVLSNHRLLLAPLRYGAGLKGKIFDGMKNGLPCVMSPTASEAMFSETMEPGIVATNPAHFITASVTLYQDKATWNDFQSAGFEILQEVYEKSAFAKALFQTIHYQLNSSRNSKSFLQKMTNYHADKHFKFMSHWIVAKRSK